MAAVTALDTFHACGRLVVAGETLDASDPIVKGREHLFTKPEPVVEQATAAPGEKRTRTRKPKAAPVVDESVPGTVEV